MITSERQYKDLTVIREHVIRVGADGSDEVDTVMVERRLPDHVEVIMPSEPLFAEAVGATAVAEHLASIGAKGGQAKTPAKAAASAANGVKGGRPPRRFPEHSASCALNRGDLVCTCGRGEESLEEIGKRASFETSQRD